MLWANSPAVVIGRNQNVWNECDLAELSRRGVQLARRASGGGTVYHDLGNLNLTFFSTREKFSKEANSAIVAAALNGHGRGEWDVRVNERTDLLVSGRKVSGSAYRLNRTTAYHHCTLLVTTDLDTLGGVLKPTLPRIVTKGVASVRYALHSMHTVVLPTQRATRESI